MPGWDFICISHSLLTMRIFSWSRFFYTYLIHIWDYLIYTWVGGFCLSFFTCKLNNNSTWLWWWGLNKSIHASCSKLLHKEQCLARLSGGHICTLSCSGGRDQENRDLRPTWAKSLWDPHLNQKSWDWWHTSVIPALREENSRITVSASLGINVRPY
jgi:hypothetical protein